MEEQLELEVDWSGLGARSRACHVTDVLLCSGEYGDIACSGRRSRSWKTDCWSARSIRTHAPDAVYAYEGIDWLTLGSERAERSIIGRSSSCTDGVEGSADDGTREAGGADSDIEIRVSDESDRRGRVKSDLDRVLKRNHEGRRSRCRSMGRDLERLADARTCVHDEITACELVDVEYRRAVRSENRIRSCSCRGSCRYSHREAVESRDFCRSLYQEAGTDSCCCDRTASVTDHDYLATVARVEAGSTDRVIGRIVGSIAAVTDYGRGVTWCRRRVRTVEA